MPADPNMLNSFAAVIAERDELLAELQAAQEREKRLQYALDRIDWYRRCLEDFQERRTVRGFAEAKAGYDSAMAELQVTQPTEEPSEFLTLYQDDPSVLGDLCREVHRLRKFIGWLDKTAEESAGVIAASWLRAQIAQRTEESTPEERDEDFTALADAAWHEWVDAKERGE